MIEFKGELTGECKRFLLRRQVRNQSVVSAIVFVLFSIPVIIASVYDDVIWLLGLIPLTMLMIFSVITPNKKDQKKFMPVCIFINLDEETIVRQCEVGQEEFHMISTIKQVEDYGDWYYLTFNYENRSPYYVCQKSLLTQGSIEEFESLFADKLIRVSD